VEVFKVEHFKRAHPGVAFPTWRSVGASEAAQFANRLRSLVALPHDADGLAIVRAVAMRGSLFTATDARSEAFDLQAVCSEVQIKPESRVFVNWYRFDSIDEFAFDDLALYFADIWYPGPDDIDIFDATLSWILSVSHNGQINTVKFRNSLVP
jgi:hypothetical protein